MIPAREVLVVGGGPAGMKAASVAAERGHRVTLLEAGTQLGGQVRHARALPARDEFGGIVTNLAREMARSGVQLRLGTAVDAALLATMSPDCVVLATGAKPYLPPEMALAGAHVVHAVNVLEGANVGARVVIADWRCDWVGLGLAERLARDGCHVRLAVNGYMAGQSIQQYTRDRWMGELHTLGVEVIPCMRVTGADEDTVYLQHTVTGAPVVLENVDTLVAATGCESEQDLERTLLASGFDNELWVIGDALCPRTCEEAVLEGLKAGLALADGSLDDADRALRLQAARSAIND